MLIWTMVGSFWFQGFRWINAIPWIVSHIFIDEVHERSVDSDFLLLELRDILKRNKKLKIILVRRHPSLAQASGNAHFKSHSNRCPLLSIKLSLAITLEALLALT